jgi:hypothetical protein
LSTKWKWVVTFTHRPLYLRRKSSRYPPGPSCWLGTLGGEIIIIFLSGIGPRFRGLKIAAQSLYLLR